MAIFVDPKLAKQWECGVCAKVMTEPRQFNCDAGDLFCKKCIMALPEKFKGPLGTCRQCPKCKRDCKIPSEYVKIPFIERQIQSLNVLCPNSKKTSFVSNTNNNSGPNIETFVPTSDGSKKRKIIVIDDAEPSDNKRLKLNTEQSCDWSGIFSEFEKHITVCEYESVKCSHGCGQILRKDLSGHKNKCPNVIIVCPNNSCDMSLKRHLMDKHVKEQCSKTKVKCQLCDKSMIRTSLYSHDRYWCKEAQVKCTFKEQGCNAVMKRKQLEDHTEKCDYNLEECEYCSEKITKRHKTTHWKKCPDIKIKCDGCSKYFARKTMAAHISNDCPETMVNCGWCQLKCKRGLKSAHLKQCTEAKFCCWFKDKGCKVELKRQELEEHKAQCKYDLVNCVHCDRKTARCDKFKHLKECPNIRIKCENGCNKFFPRRVMDNHIKNECPETMVNCVHCKLKVKRCVVTWHVKHECKEVMVNCWFSYRGCEVKVKRKEIAEHKRQCKYDLVVCKHCLNMNCAQIARCDMNKHLKECREMPIKCDNGCKKLIPRKLMDNHIKNECPERMVSCEHCKLVMKKCIVSSHQKNECTDVMVDCKFVEYGCMIKVKRKDLDRHLKNETCSHLNVVKNVCDDLKSKYKKLENRCDEYEKKINILMSRNKNDKNRNENS